MALGSKAINLPFCSTIICSIRTYSSHAEFKDQEVPVNTLLHMEDVKHFVDAETERKCDKCSREARTNRTISESWGPLRESTAFVLGD